MQRVDYLELELFHEFAILGSCPLQLVALLAIHTLSSVLRQTALCATLKRCAVAEIAENGKPCVLLSSTTFVCQVVLTL